jgi:hypothetical protein
VQVDAFAVWMLSLYASHESQLRFKHLIKQAREGGNVTMNTCVAQWIPVCL